MQKALAIFAATAAALTFAMAVSPTVQNLSGAYFSPNNVAECIVEASHLTKNLSTKIDQNMDKLESNWRFNPQTPKEDIKNLEVDTYLAKNVLMGVVKPIFETGKYKYNGVIDSQSPDQEDLAIYKEACSTKSYQSTIADAKLKLDNIENIQTLHAEAYKKTQFQSISLEVNRGEMFKTSTTANKEIKDSIVSTTTISYRK